MNNTGKLAELIGFIDRFEARNLEAVKERSSVQIDDMRTRALLLKNLFLSYDELTDHEDAIGAIERFFSRSDLNTIERLTFVGEQMADLIISAGKLIKERSNVVIQVKGFVRSFIEAAELSAEPELTNVALKLGNTFKTSFN